jgi:His/Glu/Gln/Arg/opine family amino acid ABC transporter permease subunit
VSIIGFISKYYMYYVDGIKVTLLLAFFAVIIGLILGIIFCLMRLSSFKILQGISTAYINFIRGTPLMIQIFIVFYGLPNIGLNLPDMVAGVVSLSVNAGAYTAEIIRSGIQAVNKGQMEAARSLGMTKALAMRLIILPQAIKNILPALGNQLIILIKDTSMTYIIGIHELMYNADTLRGITFLPFTPLALTAIIYFLLTYILNKGLHYYEGSLKKSD